MKKTNGESRPYSDEQRRLDEEDVGILLRRVQDMGEAVRQAKAERIANRRTAKRERRLVAALRGRLYQLSRMAGPHARDIAEIARALEDAINAERDAKDRTPVLRVKEDKAKANLFVAARDLARLLRARAEDQGNEPEAKDNPRRGEKCDKKGGKLS